jgi:nitrite reductase/ring-hydroxylating ferredoxin subunit
MSLLAPLDCMRHLRVCTIAELRAGRLLDTPSCSHNGDGDVTVSFNHAGRLLLTYSCFPVTASSIGSSPGLRPDTTSTGTAATGKRTLVVAAHATAADKSVYEVFAFDRHCYHVGYPLDLGPIEDVPARSCGANRLTRGRKSTTDLVRRSKKTDDDDAEDDASVPLPAQVAVRPGRLDCDLPPVTDSNGNVRDSSEEGPSHFTCVTCPLHNRIFDLRTGDMISIATEAAGTPDEVCVAAPFACKQRIHKVLFLRRDSSWDGTSSSIGVPPHCTVVDAWKSDAEVLDTDELYVVDSYGSSNPLAGPGQRQGVRHQRGVQVPSDAENKPRNDGEVTKRCC